MMKRKSRKETKPNLLQAARLEFCESGYFGTDSNKIATRAGYSPQTFYRWFDGKAGVFLAVYRQWIEHEIEELEAMLDSNASMKDIVDGIARNHRDFRIFRRSLHLLSLTEATVREARADSRLQQIRKIQDNLKPGAKPSEIAAVLLQIERLNDALAEDELQDMGFSVRCVHEELACLYGRLGIGAQ